MINRQLGEIVYLNTPKRAANRQVNTDEAGFIIDVTEKAYAVQFFGVPDALVVMQTSVRSTKEFHPEQELVDNFQARATNSLITHRRNLVKVIASRPDNSEREIRELSVVNIILQDRFALVG